MHQTRAVASYAALVEEVDDGEVAEVRDRANEYNARLAERGNEWVFSNEQRADYESQMVVGGSDVMGYIEIPSIGCTLPIYHGTGEAVLQVAVGHIEGSSLPVGGPSTHSVLSGHRGLASARLFTDLDKLEIGDEFMLVALGETLAYEVDQILVVEPHEMDALAIARGEDYCTLVTCTPYGENTHRLLVRGHRIDASSVSEVHVPADAILVNQDLAAVCIAAPMLLVLFVVSMIWPRKRERD